MSSTVAVIVLVYVIYVLLYTFIRKDFVLDSVSDLLSQSRQEMRDTVISTEERIVSDAITDDILHGVDGSRKKALDAINKLNKMREDESFLDESVDSFVKDLKTILVTRRLRIFLWVLVRDLYTLIPITVLIISGNLQMAIVVSVALMFISSLFEEYMIRTGLSNMFGEELSDNIMSSFSSRISIVATAMMRQLHFYILLLILLYK